MNLFLNSSAINPNDVINDLFPNLWVFIAHIIATIILLILLSKWVYNPFRKAMRARRNKIRELLDEAALKNAKANKAEKQANKMLSSAKVDANVIINNARSEAETKKNQILDEAKQQAISLNEQAKQELKKEKEQYYEDIRRNIIEVAFSAAGKLLEEEIDKDKHQSLVENFINDLE